MLVFRNGRVVTESAVLEHHDVVVQGDRIAALLPSDAGRAWPEAEVVDLAGAWLVPGFIDIHADYIEHMAAPRPTSVMDLRLAMRESERELVAHGITTMFHSVSFYRFTEFGENPMRRPEVTKRFASLVDTVHHAKHLIRHRFHARFEIDTLDRIEELEGYLRSRAVHLVSFMDHTPGQGQYRNLEVYRKTLKGYRGLSDGAIDDVIRHSQGREKMTAEGIRRVAELARSLRISVASHDDDSLEKVQLVRGFGATISEFPITLEVAKEATRLGMHTVAGAPNVVLGGSHSGNLSALEAVREGCVDILCSDYYPASLLHAVFRLKTELGMGMEAAARLVSINPARAVGLDAELGSIAAGKRADLLVIEELDQGFPVVTGTYVDGVRVAAYAYREGAR